MGAGEQVVVGLGAGAAHVGNGRDLPTQEMVLNIGPQHPATHGVLRLRLVLDGERHPRLAWRYEAPRPSLSHVAGRFGFWQDVEVG